MKAKARVENGRGSCRYINMTMLAVCLFILLLS